MEETRNSTAYCGLYCPDCNRSKAELFEQIGSLQQSLSVLNFDKYARYKADLGSSEFGEYPTFLRVLNDIKELACITCRDERNSSPCKIRKCAIDKGLAGCWECESVSGCELLAPMFKRHIGLAQNHHAIREYGIDNWSGNRGKHYRWD